jgi:hypothetical protein
MTTEPHAEQAAEWLATAQRLMVFPEPDMTVDQALSIAHIHALLATTEARPETALPDDRIEISTLRAWLNEYRNGEAAIVDQLNSYGQTFTGGLSEIVDRIGELMDLAYNQPSDGATLRVVR